MAKVRSARHYRVAKKEVMHSPEKGVFITNRKKNKLIVNIIGLMFVVFLKGLLFGLYFSKNKEL